jgi:hypothetical protein
MDHQIIRNCVLAERLERSLADYQSRRSLGVELPDPLEPSERETLDQRRVQRLHSARLFVRSLAPQRING